MPIRNLASDGALPTLSIGPATVALPEGGGGGPTVFAYLVTRSGDTSRAITADWAVTGNGSRPADASGFVGGVLPSGTITVPAGQASATLQILVAAGSTIEEEEGFTVTISAAQMSVAIAAATAGGVILAPDGYDVVVLAGQSNMIGRNGPVDPVLDATDPRIVQYGFDAQAVSLAANPLDHQDETANTVGLGLSFAKAYLATIPANRKVLLVPCAKGGTGFGTGFWRAGGGGDAPATAHVNAAMAVSAGPNAVHRLVAILWHQGESDQPDTQPQYEIDLDALIARWRTTMTGATPTTPFVCGGLLAGGTQTGTGVSAALAATPGRTGHTGFAPSTDLTGGGDNLHFDAASQRTFGGRYFTAWQGAMTNVVVPQPPAAPNLSAVAGNVQVVLTVTAGSSGGSPITGYTIARGTSSGAETVIATNVASPYTDVGVANGTGYYYTASAVNAVGTGAPSVEVTATPIAGTNLLTQPETFDGWTADLTSVTPDVAANPVGGMLDADRVAQVAGTSKHSLTTPAGQSAATSGQTYTYAVDVKAETQRYVQLFVTSAIASTKPYANFDIVAGTVVQAGGCTATVVDLGGGWKRIGMTFTATGSASFAAVIAMLVTPTNTRGGSDTVAAGSEASMLVCNAQAVAGAVANAF